MLALTQIIKKREFTLAKIYGDVGIGKTTYALKVLYEYYGGWDKALSSITSLEEFIELVEDANQHEYILEPLLIDDATLELYYMDYTEPTVKKFVKCMTIARTLSKAVLMTMPDSKILLKKLRSFEGSLSIHIVKADGHNGRIAKIYKLFTLPNGMTYTKLIGKDFYTAKLPDKVYKKYLRIRRRFLERI